VVWVVRASPWLILSIFLAFFFYCYGDHRDLHSFPTRRSSDLAWPSATKMSPFGAVTTSFGSVSAAGGSPATPALPSVSNTFPSRSEEHTSELQSPYDLVCRLLLEKKKNNTQLQSCTVNITTIP